MTAVMMPTGFRSAFRLVCEHYRCSEEEVVLMEAVVRENPDDAAVCFFALQREIFGPAAGINERIRAANETTAWMMGGGEP